MLGCIGHRVGKGVDAALGAAGSIQIHFKIGPVVVSDKTSCAPLLAGRRARFAQSPMQAK